MAFGSRQINGYRANLKGAINSCKDGAIVELDLTTAKALLLICDQAARTERQHEQPEDQ